MIGTAAAKTSVWLGVELRGVWPRNAFDSSAMPAVLRERIEAWAAAIEGFRPQALRRPGREHCPEPAVFVAMTGPECERVVRLDVPSLEALAEVDLPSVVETLRAGGVPDGAREMTEPAVWVCVHGKRDRCCAKFGVPVYEAAAKAEGVDVWHTSHLGGHRYAATLLCLPKGICYGRVQAEDMDALIRSHTDGRVHDLTLLRGRTCWSGASQAAVHFVRAHLGAMALDDVRPTDEVTNESTTTVEVEVLGATYEVVVEKRAVGGEAPPSCDKPLAAVTGWTQVSLRGPSTP